MEERLRKWTLIKKPIRCPNARVFAYERGTVKSGDLVTFEYSPGEPNIARVLGRCTELDPDGKKWKPNTLMVLMLHSTLTAGSIRPIGIDLITRVQTPGPFLEFFFFADLQFIPPEALATWDRQGYLGSGYIHKKVPELAKYFKEGEM